MVNYEGLFIIDAEYTPEAAKTVIQSITDAITKNGGTLGEVQEWGRRKLAYNVKKRRDGNYVLVLFSMETENAVKLRGSLHLNEQILKYLITRKEKPRVWTGRTRPQEASVIPV